MDSNPFLGLALISIGGLASATFYTPFKKIRNWTWETGWLAFGCVSWIVGPWVAAWLAVPHPVEILCQTSTKTLLLCYIFGALWGVGSMTNGLALRYLGLSLGYAIPLGLCAVLGTLIPPIKNGQFGALFTSTSGLVTLASVFVGVVGIIICAAAGMAKDRELSGDQKKQSVTEFNFARGVGFSILSGVMSSCMAFAIDSGKSISQTAIHLGASPLWQNAPMFIVILLGGFTSNFILCLLFAFHNGTAHEFVNPKGRPLLNNYLFCIAAGTIWYFQFLFYGMGETMMGRYSFAGWSVLMATIIIFSNLWGLVFREWQGTSSRTRGIIVTGLVVLAVSAIMTGYGGYLANLKN